MIEKMRSLLRENSMCVLATSLDNKPHCSLMAYVTDENALTVYMVTLKKSKKHSNILLNPFVSLLVDTRASGASGAQNVVALTVTGSATPLEHEEERKAIIERILERHPHLNELTCHRDVEVLSVAVESFLLLDGPTTAHFEAV